MIRPRTKAKKNLQSIANKAQEWIAEEDCYSTNQAKNQGQASNTRLLVTTSAKDESKPSETTTSASLVTAPSANLVKHKSKGPGS